MKKIKRYRELQKLEEILKSKKSELVYIRGRRRVGKSWLLADLAEANKNCLFFNGQKDLSSENSTYQFAQTWEKFSKTTTLSELRKEALTWERVFSEISIFAKNSRAKITLIFDEIQWLAKQGNGFIGAIKSEWVHWERAGNVNVLVCGSSNKFFSDHVGGEEKILRGLQTAASIWVQPLTFQQVREEWFPSWDIREVCILYMMTGGVPYYLQRVDPELGFVYAINRAFFSAERNLLEEVDEIISLDFNAQGRASVKRILGAVGQDGSSQKNIAIKTGISVSSVSKFVESLVKYKILFAKTPAFRKKYKYEDFPRYYMKDFFLNFYFNVLSPLAKQIEVNQKGLLFPYETKLSEQGYYIPNFSGKAFELLVRNIIEYGRYAPTKLSQKLMLNVPDYEVFDYWDKESQIDLLVSSQKDRICRVIECKWTDEIKKEWIDELKKKKIELPKLLARKNYLICSCSSLSVDRKNSEVDILSPEDFLEG